MNKAIGSSTIQTGASSQSLRIPARNGHGVFISAAYTLVEECSAQDWLTDTNFYVAYYVFVVWQPVAADLDAIEPARPALV